jgi:hypothetical protein
MNPAPALTAPQPPESSTPNTSQAQATAPRASARPRRRQLIVIAAHHLSRVPAPVQGLTKASMRLPAPARAAKTRGRRTIIPTPFRSSIVLTRAI